MIEYVNFVPISFDSFRFVPIRSDSQSHLQGCKIEMQIIICSLIIIGESNPALWSAIADRQSVVVLIKKRQLSERARERKILSIDRLIDEQR